jgi:hypothetical protein
MRLYPQLPVRRTATMVADALVVALLVAFVWLGVQVHGAIDGLAVLGQGVREAGLGIQSGLGSAGDAVSALPVVGDRLSRELHAAGAATGGEVARAGRAGEERVHRLADLLGLLTAALPSGFLLARAVPSRARQIRRLTAAARVLGDPVDAERRRLVATRAALTLPYGFLLAYSRDPLSDLAAGDYDALLRAAYEDAGLRAPAA